MGEKQEDIPAEFLQDQDQKAAAPEPEEELQGSDKPKRKKSEKIHNAGYKFRWLRQRYNRAERELKILYAENRALKKELTLWRKFSKRFFGRLKSLTKKYFPGVIDNPNFVYPDHKDLTDKIAEELKNYILEEGKKKKPSSSEEELEMPEEFKEC